MSATDTADLSGKATGTRGRCTPCHPGHAFSELGCWTLDIQYIVYIYIVKYSIV